MITKEAMQNYLRGVITYNIKKRISTKFVNISFEMRSKENVWGRFGGGWDWKFGFQAGGKTLVISLLVAELTFNFFPKEKK